MNLKMLAATFRGMTNRDSSAPRVFIVGPPPVDEAVWHRELVTKWSANVPAEQIPCNRSLASAQRYNEAARAAAKFVDVPFVDLCGAILATGDDQWRSHLSDGLHLSAKGNALLYSLVGARAPTLSLFKTLAHAHSPTPHATSLLADSRRAGARAARRAERGVAAAAIPTPLQHRRGAARSAGARRVPRAPRVARALTQTRVQLLSVVPGLSWLVK